MSGMLMAFIPVKNDTDSGPPGNVSMPDRIDITCEVFAADVGSYEFPMDVRWQALDNGRLYVYIDQNVNGSINPQLAYVGHWYFPLTAGIGPSYDGKWDVIEGSIQPPSDDLNVYLNMAVTLQICSTQPTAPYPIDEPGHHFGTVVDQFIFRLYVANVGAGVALDHTDLHIHVHYDITNGGG